MDSALQTYQCLPLAHPYMFVPHATWGVCNLLLICPLSSAAVLILLLSAESISFLLILHLTVWGVEPVVTHQISWLESNVQLMHVTCM